MGKALLMHWRQMPYSEIAALERERTVVILPVGAIEAHGPHLPTGCDGVIAEGIAESSLPHLAQQGLQGLILPTLEFTVADFAQEFPGTLSFSAATVEALLLDLGRSLGLQGFTHWAWANSHLDPSHLSCLRQVRLQMPLTTTLLDLTKSRWVRQLTLEFQSGACHAGQFEGSLVLARQPEWTRPEIAAGLAANPSSLVEAIRAGKRTFGEAGGDQAYFGNPALASVAEGQASYATLGRMLAEAIVAERPIKTEL